MIWKGNVSSHVLGWLLSWKDTNGVIFMGMRIRAVNCWKTIKSCIVHCWEGMIKVCCTISMEVRHCKNIRE